MKKLIVCAMILCILLCGCERSNALNDSETNEMETSKNISTEIRNSVEDIKKEEADSVESSEDYEKHTETREEFIDRMKELYSEIKNEISTIGAEKVEILFNEVTFGSCLLDTINMLKKEDIMELSNFIMPEPVSVNSMLGIKVSFDDRFYDNKYYNNNVGGVARPSKMEITVAGYDVEDCMLIFSAIEKDGHYILSDKDSALYAAEYTIKPNNIEDAKEDIKAKITSIYGEPDSIRQIEPNEYTLETIEYIYWYGTNDTVLVLYVDDYDVVHISYVWLGGEELLNDALDYAEKKQQEDAEKVYGDGNTDGL